VSELVSERASECLGFIGKRERERMRERARKRVSECVSLVTLHGNKYCRQNIQTGSLFIATYIQTTIILFSDYLQLK